MSHIFFDIFPKGQYELPLVANTADGVNAPTPITTITHVLAHVTLPLLESLRATNFEDYTIGDGERPDVVAETFYGSDRYTWLVLLSSGVRGLQDWPLSQREMEQYLIDTYGSVANAHTQIAFYRDEDGDNIDEATYNSLPDGERTLVTVYEYELEVNEARRHIKLAPRNTVASLQKQLEQVLSAANTSNS